jgi:hypothetical protein
MFVSRITFTASDEGSGVHKLGFNLIVGNRTKSYKRENVTANKNNVIYIKFLKYSKT